MSALVTPPRVARIRGGEILNSQGEILNSPSESSSSNSVPRLPLRELFPENNALLPFHNDWWTCIPDPLSPFTGLGIKVAVFPKECATICTPYL